MYTALGLLLAITGCGRSHAPAACPGPDCAPTDAATPMTVENATLDTDSACVPQIPDCAQGEVILCNTQMDADGDGWWNHQDCDDSDPAVHPCAREVLCDGIDSNCDGSEDATDASCGPGDVVVREPDAVPPQPPMHEPEPEPEPDPACVPDIPPCGRGEFVCNTQMDWDGDGWWNHQDCDDSDPAVHPCAVEACCDEVDSDCDGDNDPDPADCMCSC